MSYLVFARKFRPQSFEEIVGQETIVTTLRNAISSGRIPQNFLFSGPRGIGKTSAARILAKALNCAKGPTETPCGKCPACVEITQGNSLDVLEIDGASNRGIDEIRNLRETVKFKPVTGRFKVYIIDEVHMLTTEAFNALLKTLEEPPPHVKFVFATTEPHKVPLTILSRCHRFPFKRIPTSLITEKLEEIAKTEKLKNDSKALFLIAKAGEGSLRDAESLLDQLASFAEDKIKEEDVLLLLGLAPEEIYFSLLDALRGKKADRVFTMIGELYDGGRDLVQFARGLLEIFRNLLFFQCAEGAEKFVEMSPEGIAELKKHKDDFSRGELLLALSLVENLQGQMRRNLAPPRLLLETTLLKLLHVDGLRSVDEMIEGEEGGRKRDEGIRPDVSFPRKRESRDLGSPIKDFGDDKKKTQSITPQPRIPDPRPAAQDASPTLPALTSQWPQVIEYVKTKRMSTGIFLSESEPVEIAGGAVTLGLPAEFGFHKEMLEKDSNRKLVEEAFEVVSGQKMRVQFAITRPETDEKTSEDGSAPAAADESGKLPEIITQALNIFDGAKIIRKE